MSESQPRLHRPNYDKFRQSLERLKEQYANYQRKTHVLRPELDKRAVAESVIQRFETCLACLREVLPGRNSQWRKYIDARNNTAHEYDCDKAEACLKLVSDFIKKAVDFDRTLSAGAGAPSVLGQNQAVSG